MLILLFHSKSFESLKLATILNMLPIFHQSIFHHINFQSFWNWFSGWFVGRSVIRVLIDTSKQAWAQATENVAKTEAENAAKIADNLV